MSLLACDEVGNTLIQVRGLFFTAAGLYSHVTKSVVYYIYFRGSLSRYVDSTWPRRSRDRVPGAMRFSAPVQTDLRAHVESCTTGAESLCRG